MAKIIIEIKDSNTNKEHCDVKLNVTNSKNATDSEKNMVAVVYNAVCNTLNNLKNQEENN